MDSLVIQACVFMGYLDSKSYCLVGKEDIVCYFSLSCRSNI